MSDVSTITGTDISFSSPRVGVAHFADHDDVGVLAHHTAQHGGERRALLGVDRNLGHAIDLPLDRILDGDDVDAAGLEIGQGGIEHRGLAGSGRASHEHEPIGLRERGDQRLGAAFLVAKGVDRQQTGPALDHSLVFA